MSVEPRASRFVLARAGIGLAAQVVTTAIELPGRTIRAGIHLPAALLGAGARGYLQLTHTVNGLAVKGDEVLELVFPPRTAQPAWVTFDEDEAVAEAEDAAEAEAEPAGTVDELPLDLDGLDGSNETR